MVKYFLDSYDPLKSDEFYKIYLVDIIKSAKFHAVYKTAKINHEEIVQSNLSENLTQNMIVLCKIYICDSILKCGQEAFIQGYIDTETMFKIKDYMDTLFGDIRPQLAALIEGTHFEDRDYFSILVHEGGVPYQNMYEEAANCRTNAYDKLDAIDKDLKPLSQKLASRL